MAKARFRIGTHRVSAGLDPTQAAYTRDIRDQMKSVEANFSRFLQLIEGSSDQVIMSILQPIFDRSQELCPVDTGKLQSSGYVAVRKFRGRTQGEIGYGKGGNPHYAVYVHENLDAHHEPPTQAKFLQRAVEEALPGLLNDAANEYKGLLGL